MKTSEVPLEHSVSTAGFLPVGSHSSGRVPLWVHRSCVLVFFGPEVDDQPKARGCRKNRSQASNAAENEVTLRRHHLLEHTCGNNGKSYWPKYCRQENLIKQDFGSETPLVNNLQRILGFFTEMRSKFVSEERCFIFSILTTFVVTPGHYNKRK